MAAIPELIVQSPAGVGRQRAVMCDGFSGVPGTLPAYVVLVTDGSPEADREATLLRLELRRQVLGASGTHLETANILCGVAPCPAQRSDFGCSALTQTLSRKVLVFIGSGTAAMDESLPLPQWNGQIAGIVLTPAGNHVPPMPVWLAKKNIGRWQVSAAEFAPLVFAAAGVTSPERRVFISYRVDEASTLAEQLFEALAKKNFDVYVDRFRTDAGADFQQRIARELAHKSMVVFLESKGILASQWTRYEIAIAKSSRLGILALHLPDGMPIPDIDDSRRIEVSPESGGRLSCDDMNGVVERIAMAETASQMRRRQMMRQNMMRALRQAGVPNVRAANGFVEVNATQAYSVWLPGRPAELTDFHYVATSCGNGRNVIVAPSDRFVGVDRARMQWLANAAQVRAFDEGFMQQVAVAMRQGRL
jgi:TIR domain